MRLKEISSEVFKSDEAIIRVSRREIEFLKDRVSSAPRGRVRLCAHASNEDLLHEMIIVLTQQTYIRPHKHVQKSESFHIIEGTVDVVVLDDDGKVLDVIELGELASGRQFFYRISQPIFHTLIIRSPILVVHETTNGPFNRADAIFAPWSPEEHDPTAKQYLRDLETIVASRVKRSRL